MGWRADRVSDDRGVAEISTRSLGEVRLAARADRWVSGQQVGKGTGHRTTLFTARAADKRATVDWARLLARAEPTGCDGSGFAGVRIDDGAATNCALMRGVACDARRNAPTARGDPASGVGS